MANGFSVHQIVVFHVYLVKEIFHSAEVIFIKADNAEVLEDQILTSLLRCL
jgi:hypothetical protein